MRLRPWFLLVVFCAPLLAQSGPQLDMNLHHLEGKADEVVSVNLDGESLEQGRKLLAIRNGVGKSVKELLNGLKGVYLRRFFFGNKKAYDEGDVDSIRQQLKQPGWVPMIDVKVRQKEEAVTVYSYMQNEKLTGLTVLSSEPQEVTVINIVGDVDLEGLAELGRQMGIPAMTIATIELSTKKPPLVEPQPKQPAKP
jgi:hypothetical protein